MNVSHGILSAGSQAYQSGSELQRSPAEVFHAHKVQQAFEQGQHRYRAVLMGYWDKEGQPTEQCPQQLRLLADYGIAPTKASLWSISHRRTEPEYQQGPKQPRPMRTLCKGIRSNTTAIDNWHFDMHIGFINPEVLEAYKRDASTPFSNRNEWGGDYEYIYLNSKPLLGHESHLEKRLEMARRQESLCFDQSEGHFQADGSRTPAHPKELSGYKYETGLRSAGYFGVKYLDLDEVLTTGYREQDYATIIVDQDNLRKPWQPYIWQRFLEQHNRTDHPVCLAYYRKDQATLDLYYPKELPGLMSGEYAKAVVYLNRLYFLLKITPAVVARHFSVLPLPQAMQAVITAAQETKGLLEKLHSPQWHCYLTLTDRKQTQDQMLASIRSLTHPNCHFTGTGYSSLIDILISKSLMEISLSSEVSDRKPTTQQGPGDAMALSLQKLKHGDIHALLERLTPLKNHLALTRELIAQELDAREITLTPLLTIKNPLIAGELLLHGASIPFPGQWLVPRLALMGMISNDPDILLLIRNIKHTFTEEQWAQVISCVQQQLETMNRDDSFESETLSISEKIVRRMKNDAMTTDDEVRTELGLPTFRVAAASAIHFLQQIPPMDVRPVERALPYEPCTLEILPVASVLAEIIHRQHRACSLNIVNLYDFPANTQQILEQYYLTPSKGLIKEGINSNQTCDLFRDIHGADHVCRTAINVEWLCELFKKYRQDKGWLSAKACTLLQYAALYHDVTAEVHDKALEEDLAAEAMSRDLNPLIEQKDRALFNDVISALRNKNVNDMKPEQIKVPFSKDCPSIRERLFRRILRMSDSMEIARCFPVDDQFAPPAKGRDRFNLEYSDLPDIYRNNAGFRTELDAGFENMMDLAFTTGGRCPDDKRTRNSAGRRYRMRDSGSANQFRKWVMATCPDTYRRIKTEQEWLIGRRIAAEIGLHFYSFEGDAPADKPVIVHDGDFGQFMERIQPVIDKMTPLQRQTFHLLPDLTEWVAEARQLTGDRWQPEPTTGTLSKLDLLYSAELREVLHKRNRKVVMKTLTLLDGITEEYLRIVKRDDPEEEYPLQPATEALQEKARIEARKKELEAILTERVE